MSKRSVMKSVQIALLVTGLCTSCSLTNYLSDSFKNDSLDVDLAQHELSQEQQAEIAKQKAARLSKTTETITVLLNGHKLQYLSQVAKLYNDHDLKLFWQDKAQTEQFLNAFASVVASGVSSSQARTLKQIAQLDNLPTLTEEQQLARDILLTDALLDYANYSTNVDSQAQRWLYSNNAYNPTTPGELLEQQWRNVLAQTNISAFVQGLENQNHLYQQTTVYWHNLVKNHQFTQARKLALNAQRLRVIPSFNNGIFVNIPSYHLEYVRNGSPALTSKVIVGKPARKTPVMISKLSNVVVNPPWNAPVRLINEDLLPKMKRDPGYLSRNGYSILDSRGNVVNPSSINWNSIGNKFPYHVRQNAGEQSALGRFKFNMPSSDAIYLHDTPNHGLFSRKDRALSSGCVRVDKADALATILLQEAGWSVDRKKRVLDSKKTTWATIKSDNPVYLYYVTAWVDNGTVHTLPDIYGYDKTAEPSYIDWNIIQRYIK